MNSTMAKFGFPDTEIAQIGQWVALVRPNQVTLGAMVLVCQEEVKAFSDVSSAGITDFGKLVRATEAALKSAFHYDKINYLMLMMVDPDVHFHVIPRYETERTFMDQVFSDTWWPKPPDVTVPVAIAPETLTGIRDKIRSCWPVKGF